MELVASIAFRLSAVAASVPVDGTGFLAVVEPVAVVVQAARIVRAAFAAVRDILPVEAFAVVRRVAEPETAARARTSGFALRSGIAVPGLPPVAMSFVVEPVAAWALAVVPYRTGFPPMPFSALPPFYRRFPLACPEVPAPLPA